jgi:hypothetical protein
MVHFPPLPSCTYEFSTGCSGINQSGFPHSDIPGSKPACGSPRLIAACHVLHRLLAPRHSPYALSSLTKCSRHLTASMWSKNYRLQSIQLSKSRDSLFAFRKTLGPPRALVRLACRAEALWRFSLFKPDPRFAKAGGEYRARTGDLLVANQALSQLS